MIMRVKTAQSGTAMEVCVVRLTLYLCLPSVSLGLYLSNLSLQCTVAHACLLFPQETP